MAINLVVSRAEAVQRIKPQIERGCEIRDFAINSECDCDAAEVKRYQWEKYNIALLTMLFDDSSLANEFAVSVKQGVFYNDLGPKVGEFRRYVNRGVTCLESILERLLLIPDPRDQPNLSHSKPILENDIFIVHGHDESAKESVARFIERLSLHPIILHEQPNAGRTIIEKFEAHSNVGFAVVLLTSDDIGAPQDKASETKLRARQNVILELGYFMGKLGRGKVCALYKEGVEIPSDYQGVLYILMDSAGAWRMALAKEIKNAGIEVDLNKL